MGKSAQFFSGLIVSFIFFMQSYSMEHRESLSHEEIIARLIAASENSLANNQPLLVTNTIRFWRKDECFGCPINTVSISLLDNEKTATLAIEYVKHWAKKLNGLLEWRVFPTTTPSTMGDILLDNGFSFNGTVHVMIYNVGGEIYNLPISEPIVIERLSDIELVPTWTKIIQKAFNFFWRNQHAYQQYVEKGIGDDTAMAGALEFYSGYYDRKLVGTGGLYIGDDCGHINAIATDKVFRGKGLATSMILTLLKRAQDLGLKHVLLQCDDSTVNFYTKIGFKNAFDIKIYALDE